MPLPMTVSQINKLGDRLRRAQAAGTAPAEADLRLLDALRGAHDEPLASVRRVLREEIGLEATSRLKTTGTIVEKLQRDKSRLSRMQDIAGLRVVVEMTLTQQNELVAKIRSRFPDAEIADRRDAPNHGYRAVHVVVKVDDCWIEIQVRTHLQDAWAQAFEKIADAWGRDIRYGGSPRDAERRMGTQSRADVVAKMMDEAQTIAQTEVMRDRAEWELGAAPTPEVEAHLQELKELQQVHAELVSILATFAEVDP